MGNTVNDNVGIGIKVGRESTATGNTVIGNAHMGISVREGSTVTGNVVMVVIFFL